MMTILTYDTTFAGFLTAVFEVYERKLTMVKLCREPPQPDAFATLLDVQTDVLKARRVWNGLGKKLPAEGREKLWHVWLSGLPDADAHLLEMIRRTFAREGAGEDFGNPSVLFVAQTARRVWREKHRMEAFVRFQQIEDGLFYAGIEPDFNVLPLIATHFKSRYADQAWLIYDIKRKYGISYSPQSDRVEEVIPEFTEGRSALDAQKHFSENELLYQALWQDYFKHTGIPARKNLELHLRHIPRRYWKHLTEKH